MFWQNNDKLFYVFFPGKDLTIENHVFFFIIYNLNCYKVPPRRCFFGGKKRFQNKIAFSGSYHFDNEKLIQLENLQQSINHLRLHLSTMYREDMCMNHGLIWANKCENNLKIVKHILKE